MTEESSAPWLASRKGRRVGHILWMVGFALWVLAVGVRNGNNFSYAFGAVLGYASMIGIGCYLAVIAKPLSNSHLHPGVFGIVMIALAMYQWLP